MAVGAAIFFHSLVSGPRLDIEKEEYNGWN